MSWKWFGVKTLFRTKTQGVPTFKDSSYDTEATLIEARILLVRARSFNEAIAKAEAEAKEYASEQYRNPYGQIVKQKYLGACEAFELYDDPASGVEVFSTTALIPQSISDNEIVKRHFGAREGKIERKRRRKFYNEELGVITKSDT